MKKAWRLSYDWTSKKGNVWHEDFIFDTKKKAEEALDRHTAEHPNTENVQIERSLAPSTQYERELIAAEKSHRKVYYWNAGHYAKGWAHAGVNHLSDYEKAAETLGFDLVDFGNDSPTGRAQHGFYCYAVKKTANN